MDMFDKLVEIAKKEEIPQVDVSLNVMNSISNVRIDTHRQDVKTMGLMATVSAIAASIIMTFSIHAYNEHKKIDPMMYLFADAEIMYEEYVYDMSFYGMIED